MRYWRGTPGSYRGDWAWVVNSFLASDARCILSLKTKVAARGVRTSECTVTCVTFAAAGDSAAHDCMTEI